MPMRDEAAYRREGFTEGVNVTLGDGQAWSLPRVRVAFVVDGDDVLTPYVKSDSPAVEGKSFASLLKALEDAADDTAFYKAAWLLGKTLILANYDLTPEELCEVWHVSLDGSDPAAAEMTKAALDVARGRGGSLPKP